MLRDTVDDIPWVEKYRPKTIRDVVHQEPVKRMLLNVFKTGTMPHCLFFGPPGTGKTSAALALCSELFGQTAFKRRVLELNASDDRGIAVVRDKIKSWTRTIVGSSSNTGNPGCSCAPDWKVVILDEADMMTPDAQSALRRIMEDNTKTTRFIIICNYVSRIIDPIASRCAKYRFEPIGHAAQLGRLHSIAQAEHIPAETKALEAILDVSEGDLRVSVMLLQSAASLLDRTGAAALTPSIVQQVTGAPPASVAQQIIDTVFQKNYPGNTNSALLSLQQGIMAEGWDVLQLLRQVLKHVISTDAVSDLHKAAMISVIATAQFRLSQGASEALQLLEVLTCLTREANHYHSLSNLA